LFAEQHKNEMLLKLQNEVKLGRILGTFKNMPISTLQISPIGLVPKPDGNWRLITNLSQNFLIFPALAYYDTEASNAHHYNGYRNGYKNNAV
jgi:hypothetical protein